MKNEPDTAIIIRAATQQQRMRAQALAELVGAGFTGPAPAQAPSSPDLGPILPDWARPRRRGTTRLPPRAPGFGRH